MKDRGTTPVPGEAIALLPPGVEQTRALRDVGPLLWLVVTGIAYTARVAGKNRQWLRAQWWAYVPFMAVVMYPALLPWQVYRLRSRRYATYVVRDRSGRIEVTATIQAKAGHIWILDDHQVRHRGVGHAATLRSEILPWLLAAVDQYGITLELTAANDRLAGIYWLEISGLEDVGTAFPFGRRMRRLPAAADGSAAESVEPTR